MDLIIKEFFQTVEKITVIFKQFERIITGNWKQADTSDITLSVKNQQQYKPSTKWRKSKLTIQGCTTKLLFIEHSR